MSIDYTRIALTGVAVCLSVGASYFGQPFIIDNTNAINGVITVFSILAGFLIAVMTLLADSILSKTNDWQELQLMKETLKRKIFRQQILFYLYLITLGFALLIFLIPKSFGEVQKIAEYGFLFLATLVFLLSFGLPVSLMRIQMEKYEGVLESVKPKVLKKANDISGIDS